MRPARTRKTTRPRRTTPSRLSANYAAEPIRSGSNSSRDGSAPSRCRSVLLWWWLSLLLRSLSSRHFISAFYLGVSSPQADRAEARVVHTALIDLVKSTNAAMLGPSHERLPDVIVVFGQLLTTPDLCDDGVPAQIVQLLKQVGSRWDRGSTRACCRD